jgi:hypothetical protein
VPRRSFALAFYVVVMAAASAAFVLLFYKNYGRAWIPGIALAVVTLACTGWSLRSALLGRWKAAFSATAVHGVLILVTVAATAFPLLGAYHSNRDIARQAVTNLRVGETLVTYRFFHHTLEYYTGYRVSDHLPDLAALQQYASGRFGLLVVTERARLAEVRALPGFSCEILAAVGKVRLVRLSPK